MMQLNSPVRKLIPEIVNFLIWLIAFLVACLVEQSLGLPLVSLTLVALAVRNQSTIWTLCFVGVSAILLTTTLSTNFFIIWLIVLTMSLLYRSPMLNNNKLVLPRLAVVVVSALLIAVIKNPSLNTSFIFHTGVSFVVAGYLIWRSIGKKTQNASNDVLRLRTSLISPFRYEKQSGSMII